MKKIMSKTMQKTLTLALCCAGLFGGTAGLAMEPPVVHEQDMKKLEDMMGTLEAQKEASDKYQQEMLEIERFRAMLRELHWIIQRNVAFMKDWQANGDCLAAKRALEILAGDKKNLLTKKKKLQAESAVFGAGATPAVGQLYAQSMAELDQAIQGMDEIENRLASTCGAKSSPANQSDNTPSSNQR
ncbi:MAG: hypothetical protein Q4G66_10775 [bacterium]|nr:hypothetical protein [bacterium]